MSSKKLNTISEVVNEKLWFSKDYKTEAMKYGLKEEPQARVKYIEATNNQVKETGMWVNNDYPFLGASPDGLILHDKDVVGVLEIKCLQILKDCTVEDLINRSKTEKNPKLSSQCFKIVDDKLILKKGSPYYYQIQLQMLVTGVKFCDFVLHSPKGPPSIERISEDVTLQDIIIKNTKVFWERALVPEYFEKRLPRNLPLMIL